MDIAQFFELVKNPAKYEKMLQELTDAEARVKEQASRLGDLSKAADLRKLAEDMVEKARKEVEEMKAAQNKAEETRKKILDEEFAKISVMKSEANDVLFQGKHALAEAQAVMTAAQQKEKDLRKEQENLAQAQINVDKLNSELLGRLNKLRSVMS